MIRLAVISILFTIITIAVALYAIASTIGRAVLPVINTLGGG